MLFAFPYTCCAAEEVGVSAQIEELSSGNVLVSFYGEDLTALTNAVFSVEYSSLAFKLVRAEASFVEFEGESYINFSGLWTFGERNDGSGAAAGYISSNGATKKGRVRICEFELECVNNFSPNGTVVAFAEELITNDGNYKNDINKEERKELCRSSLTSPTPGDLNGDGVFDVLDAAYLERYLSGHIALTDDELFLMDINCDGNITYRDFYLLIKLEGEKITELDVNGDTVLDVLDIATLERALWRENVLDEREYAIADINCDGTYTPEDFSAALNMALAA